MQPVSLGSLAELLALEHITEQACIIADIRMPGEAGLPLPALLAQRGLDIPVIIVTAEDFEPARIRARHAGAAAFLRKPVDGQALIDMIEWVLKPSV
jgi:FixJ family two-component response regulator